jgi:PPOX class probable F420-dependent enzyme
VADSFEGKYLSLTSFRRDGTGVATPVWFAQQDGRLFVKTDGDSYKVKRIARNPSVTVAICTASGRLRSEPVPACAEFLSGSEAKRVEELMARKYRLERVLILPLYRVVQRIRGRRARGKDSVFLAITPTERPRARP